MVRRFIKIHLFWFRLSCKFNFLLMDVPIYRHFFFIKMKPAVFVGFYTLKASMSMDMSHLTDTGGIMRIFENPF